MLDLLIRCCLLSSEKLMKDKCIEFLCREKFLSLYDKYLVMKKKHYRAINSEACMSSIQIY